MMSGLLHNLHLSFFLEHVNTLRAHFCTSYVVPALQLLPLDPLSLLQMSPFPPSSFPQEPSGIRIPLLAAPANRLLQKSQITSLSKTHKASRDPAITGQVQASGQAPTGCVDPAFWRGPPATPHSLPLSLHTSSVGVLSQDLFLPKQTVGDCPCIPSDIRTAQIETGHTPVSGSDLPSQMNSAVLGHPYLDVQTFNSCKNEISAISPTWCCPRVWALWTSELGCGLGTIRVWEVLLHSALTSCFAGPQFLQECLLNPSLLFLPIAIIIFYQSPEYFISCFLSCLSFTSLLGHTNHLPVIININHILHPRYVLHPRYGPVG